MEHTEEETTGGEGMRGAIYKVTCTANGKLYVGQTRGEVGVRWKHHVSAARGVHNTMPFVCAIRKYGADAFVVETLEVVAIDILDDRERYWIQELCALIGFGRGYNVQAGGALSSEQVAAIRLGVTRHNSLRTLTAIRDTLTSVRIRTHATSIALWVYRDAALIKKCMWSFGPHSTTQEDAMARASEWALKLMGGDASKIQTEMDTRRAPAKAQAARVSVATLHEKGALYAMIHPMPKYICVWVVAHEGVIRRRDMTRLQFAFGGAHMSYDEAMAKARAHASALTDDVRDGIPTKKYRGAPTDVVSATITVGKTTVDARCFSKDGTTTRSTFRIGTSGRSKEDTLAHAHATISRFTPHITVFTTPQRGKNHKLTAAGGAGAGAGAGVAADADSTTANAEDEDSATDAEDAASDVEEEDDTTAMAAHAAKRKRQDATTEDGDSAPPAKRARVTG